jgi:serine/threonine protein kinase
VAETVQHAHGRDVVHRDIKPENIIMNYEQDGSWIPYLTDFDLAWFSTATQVTKEAMGTLFYAAPEQLAKPTSSVAHAPTTDVYALGQLLFFLLTGGDPVPLNQADNRRALADRLSQGYSQEAGQRIMSLYCTCVEIDPSLRFQSMRRICDKLTQIHQRLTATDATSRIPMTQFFAELHYSLVGLVPTDVDHSSYASLSRRTQITTSTRESSGAGEFVLVAHFVPKELMNDGGSNESLRVVLNGKIDSAIRKYKNVKRRSGKQGAYEVFIDIDDLSPNLLAVEKCNKVLSRVIDALER